MKSTLIVMLILSASIVTAQNDSAYQTKFNKIQLGEGEFVSTYEDGLFVSIGADVRNATIGGTVNPQALDATLDLYIRNGNIELGICYEYFEYINYKSTNTYIKYVDDLGIRNKWELVHGFEIGKIYRGRDSYSTEALTTAVRYKIGRFKIGYTGELRNRTDIGDVMFSGRIKLHFQITKE